VDGPKRSCCELEVPQLKHESSEDFLGVAIICHLKSQAEVHPVGIFRRYMDFVLRIVLAIIATFSWILIWI
jgi:hypothetical protein